MKESAGICTYRLDDEHYPNTLSLRYMIGGPFGQRGQSPREVILHVPEGAYSTTVSAVFEGNITVLSQETLLSSIVFSQT